MRFYPRDDVAIHREAMETVRDNVRTSQSALPFTTISSIRITASVFVTFAMRR
jgi:hypothetical protein